MPTIAELQIKVDSSPLEQATKGLNDFAVAADKASSATNRKKVADDQLATTAKQTAVDQDNAAKATAKQSKELETLIGKIDPVTKKLNELAKQEALLFQNKDSFSPAVFNAYNQKLEESLNKILEVGSAQKSLSSSTDGVPERLKAVAQASYDSALAQEKLTTAFRGASEAEQGLVSSGAVSAANARAAAALDEFNAKRQLAGATNSAADAEKNQAESLGVLLNRIDPTLKKLQELESLQKQLNSQKPNLSTEEYEKFNRILDANRQTLSRYNTALQTTGKTAKETAFALRGLPAQFTDIVVSLQGGQAPLTVLLQQGGQIKDMFGGIVPALKAVGTAALAMITPLSVGLTVLGAVAIAAYKGSNELTAFNKALIQSGNFAGVSAPQFTQFRDSLESSGLNAGKAADALTQLASGGEVVGSIFTKVAESAILFEKATGTALNSIIEDFNSIGKDPVNAAVRLDEKYRFLTASVLAQAEALSRNGQDSEAATLLQERLADQVKLTADEMIDQAGYIEKAWTGVKGVITGTWDALKGIGRQTTSLDELNKLIEQRTILENRQANNQKYLGGLGGSGIQKEIDDTNALIKQKQLLINYEDFGAKNAADAEDKRRDAVSAQASSLKRYETSVKGVAKAEDDLRKVRLENQKIKDGGEPISDRQAEVMATNEARAIEALTKAKEKEAKVRSTPINTRDVTEVKNGLAELTAEYEGYYKRVTALGEANVVSAEATYRSQKAILEAQRDAVSQSYDNQINSIQKLRDNKKNTAAQNISLDNQLTKAESDRAIALEKVDAKLDVLQTKEKGRIDKRTASISAYKDALDAQLESLRDEGQRAIDGAGRGDRDAAVAKQLADIDRTFDKQQRSLAKSLGEGMDPVEYAEKLRDLKDAHTEMTNQIIANDAGIKEANADWTNGFTKAIANAQDDATNFAKATESAVTGAFNSMADALATFVTTGKLDFRSLTISILSDIAKIAARQATLGALSSLFGGVFGGAASAGTTVASSGFSEYGQITTVQKDGGAWNGGTQFFAQGGAFTNSIVSSPTSFPMSGGKTGVMGEAGPEAIIPLSRAADGSLGVKMVGGGGSGGVVVYVSITGDGTSTETTDTGYSGFGKEIGAFVESKYRELQSRDLSPGGTLTRAINER